MSAACPMCAEDVADTARICPHCGTVLRHDTPPTQVARTVIMEAHTALPPPTATPTPGRSRIPRIEPMWVIAALVVLSAAALGALVIVWPSIRPMIPVASIDPSTPSPAAPPNAPSVVTPSATAPAAADPAVAHAAVIAPPTAEPAVDPDAPASAEPVASPRRFAPPVVLYDDEVFNAESPGPPITHTWHPPGGPEVTLSGRALERSDGSSVNLRLRGEWPGDTDVLATANVSSAASFSLRINEREDGRLIARFEESPHSSDPGIARAVLLEWNAQVGAVRATDLWDGSAADEPPPWALVSQRGGF